MFKLKDSLIGSKLKFTIRNGNGPGGVITAICQVAKSGETFIVLSNSQYINGGYGAKNLRGYKYAMAFGPNGIINRDTFSPNLISVELEAVPIITKKGSNGAIFRRVYEHGDSLVFVGPVKKDPDQCEQPSAAITILDWEYAKNTGWEYYKKEMSAEDKLKVQPKIAVNI